MSYSCFLDARGAVAWAQKLTISGVEPLQIVASARAPGYDIRPAEAYAVIVMP